MTLFPFMLLAQAVAPPLLLPLEPAPAPMLLPVIIVAAPVSVPTLDIAPPPVIAPELREEVRAVIEAAIDSGDTQAVAAVVKFAKSTNPETAGQIETLHQIYLARVAERKARGEAQRMADLREAGPFDYIKGSVELGASQSTGNTDTLGLYGSATIEREGIDWRHKLIASIDIQQNEDVTTAERINVAYQPNYKIDDRFYAFGIGQYERDRFQGYYHRLTAGVGLGYQLISERGIKLELEGGPAVRRTEFVELSDETNPAARASLALRWTVSPTLSLTQDTSLYLERGASNAIATTALDTKLLGALKARLSYNIQYQPEVFDGRDQIDTRSRATLVYSF